MAYWVYHITYVFHPEMCSNLRPGPGFNRLIKQHVCNKRGMQRTQSQRSVSSLLDPSEDLLVPWV